MFSVFSVFSVFERSCFESVLMNLHCLSDASSLCLCAADTEFVVHSSDYCRHTLHSFQDNLQGFLLGEEIANIGKKGDIDNSENCIVPLEESVASLDCIGMELHFAFAFAFALLPSETSAEASESYVALDQVSAASRPSVER